MEDFVKILIEKVNMIGTFKELESELNNLKQYKVSLLKKSRWEDDAVIFLLDLKEKLYSIKIHFEKYPLASHIYNSPDKLNILSKTMYISHIIYTTICDNIKIEIIRIVIYEYIEGVPLDKKVKSASNADIAEYQRQLYKCCSELMLLGFNVFIRDLGDFIVAKDHIILTDYNAIMECENSSIEARYGVLNIIDFVIKKVLNNDYVSFTTERPYLK